MPNENINTQPSRRFTTFGGVFTPCTLTILGVIMFLRFGEVVGNTGILHAVLVVGLAKLITTLTALSLSATATNTQVKGGGAYYIISRSLGIEFGGAIGVVFFLSQAVSAALYVVGFTEALMAVVPVLSAYPKVVASVINAAVFACVFTGADWTIKMQYGILSILVLSILSFLAGAGLGWSPQLVAANWNPDYSRGHSFWTMFALFFPAVTGIMAGANMSGDLKNPAKSIPKGTLLSILFTGLIYLSFAVLLGASSERELLKNDLMIVSHRALFPFLIICGVLSATLSSALGSMMGAPRILQALGRDRIIPLLNPFAKGSGPAGEPRRATVLSFIIAEAAILLGDIDAIAPVITMFFLITYGGINLATFMESYSGNPSYRPTFRWSHWTLSLTGAVLCGGVMLLINPMWAIIAVTVMAAIYKYLQRRELRVSWGDVVSGSIFENIRLNLLKLEDQAYHRKNWRPAVIVMGAASSDRLHIAVYGRRLAGPHGLLMLGQVLTGAIEDQLERHENLLRAMRKLSSDNDLYAFPAPVFAPDIGAGIVSLMQCAGVGAMRPNLALFGWSADSVGRQSLAANICSVARMGRSVALLRQERTPDDPWAVEPGSIDVWWQGKGSNGHLMLLLAHVLRSNPGMRSKTVRLIRMLPSEAGMQDTLLHLDGLAKDVRIRCSSVVIQGGSFTEAIRKESSRAALVILGMANPCEAGRDYLDRLEAIVEGIPSVIFVYSAGDMDLHV